MQIGSTSNYTSNDSKAIAGKTKYIDSIDKRISDFAEVFDKMFYKVPGKMYVSAYMTSNVDISECITKDKYQKFSNKLIFISDNVNDQTGKIHQVKPDLNYIKKLPVIEF